ncbi:MAG TPA: hypothetical protein VJN69_11360 [Candidatus Acidoferrales bacterium]|nr:hypothetical protein [Candidatus Acidoferrales bacterium]
MKIALGVAAMALLAAVPAGAQTIGGTISPPRLLSQKLPWIPPAAFNATEVSGAESTYVPSTFVTFDTAVAAGKVQLKELGKTVAEAATDSRAAARANATKVRFAQDDRGRVVLSRN